MSATAPQPLLPEIPPCCCCCCGLASSCCASWHAAGSSCFCTAASWPAWMMLPFRSKKPSPAPRSMSGNDRACSRGMALRKSARPPSKEAMQVEASVNTVAGAVDWRPTTSMPALSAAPPLVNTNKLPLLPFPTRTRSSRYVVVRVTSDSLPILRCSPPFMLSAKDSTGGSKSTFTVSPFVPTGSTLPLRPTAPGIKPKSLKATLFVTMPGLRTL
mmetsp:Transcript_8118/g.20040  ORF Transcript_8118/g.20040 Transcript_8118/m.20040 type:complete len:215 (+) Transcript_8118:1593-2237(+)